MNGALAPAGAGIFGGVHERNNNLGAISAGNGNGSTMKPKLAGLTGWLLARLGAASRPRPRLALVERIALAPRQSLALVEAEGRRFLVATSADGAPSFYPLDGPGTSAARSAPTAPRSLNRTNQPGTRVSW
jgi:hypothetical protein